MADKTRVVRLRTGKFREDANNAVTQIIHSDAGTTGIAIGRRAAKEGVLFGRYDRCDNEGLPVLTHISISRVHMLAVEIADQRYAIDTASTVAANGLEAGVPRGT